METPTNGDDKPYVCDQCGMKYKTRPGLTYHRKTHAASKTNGGGNSSQSSPWTGTAKSNDAAALLNPDESTTNSMFESHGYDDVNSLSNMSHTATNSAANHDKQAGMIL